MSIPKPVSLSLNTWLMIQKKISSTHTIYNNNNLQQLTQAIEKRWQIPHGDCQRWQQCVDSLPNSQHNANTIKFSIDDIISVSSTCKEYNTGSTQAIEQALMGLSPWRKGPFKIFDTYIQAEWQSNWKWQRISNHQIDHIFQGCDVLDIGCGNGYYGWRMFESGANSIIGIDGSLLLNYQFAVCKMYQPNSPIMLFPIRFEILPPAIKNFDVVVSMGVLSHAKEPMQHLNAYKKRMREGATLLLETLIIENEEISVLHPKERYAKMNNVFILPSPSTLVQWLEEVGFKQITIHEINQTSTEEQRATKWMGNQSLKDFLDPQDANKTIEGYPAPTRILLTCKR